MAATSRRAEPSPPKRPSISPLSVAKSSPTTFRDALMQDERNDDEDHLGKDADSASVELRDMQDDRSSSLSDVEDDEEEHAHLFDVVYRASIAGPRPASTPHDIDSEAETERLEQTPSKVGRHDDGVGKTPSKLSQAAAANDLSDPPSPLPNGSGVDSSIGAGGANGKKRKRSDTAESSLTSAESDLGGSPRKRSNESPAEETTAGDEAAEEDPTRSESATAHEDIGGHLEAPAALDARAGNRGRRVGKKSGKLKKDAVKRADAEDPTIVLIEEEQEEDSGARLIEKLQHKGPASSVFEDLAKRFANIHERVYNDKLAAVAAELEMLSQPDCKHPDYLRQVACVDARYTKQVSEVQAFYKFKMETLRISTLAERSQRHSQYFQTAREIRESAHYELGEDWYNIQRDRRQGNNVNEGKYIVKFPAKRSEQLRNQAKYNQEVSVLSGIAKYVGFPAAPPVQGTEGAGSDALESDLKSMQLPKRVAPQPTNHSTPTVYLPNHFAEPQSDRIAHDQFIEQTAWARPVGPIPNHGTPNLTHTPDWANAVSSTSKYRNLSTPIAHRNVSGADNEPAEAQSNTKQSTHAQPPSSERGQLGPFHFAKEAQGPTSSPIAVPKQRHGGASSSAEPQREITSFRNFSNVSGSSTIDAPPDSAEREHERPVDKERERERNPERERDREQERSRQTPMQQHQQAVLQPRDGSVPNGVFDTSQIHRFSASSPGSAGAAKAETYSSATSFRPRDGAFGTPTPAPPPIGVGQGAGKS